MKYLTLLFLLSTLSFGIDKKTPTGGTVKDKPGKSQSGTQLDLETKGMSKRSDSLGYTYSQYSNTGCGSSGWPADGSPTVYSDLNRGIYLVIFTCSGSGGGEGTIAGRIRVGSTYIDQVNMLNRVNSSYEGGFSRTFPVTITTDNTRVGGYGAILNTSSTGCTCEWHIVKLRDL
jgi:hypothetical protein